MIDIPGWVLVLLAGLAALLLGVAVGSPVKPRTRTVLAWLAAVLGALLTILGLLAAMRS